MGHKSLFKGVNCNYTAGSIIDRIWGLVKIWTPGLKAKFGKLNLDVLNDVFFNRKELHSNGAAILDGHGCTDLNKVGANEWLPI